MDLIHVFDLCEGLWESTAVLDRPEEATLDTVGVEVKGKTYNFATDFLPITKDGILNERYKRPGIYIWRQESSGAYYVGQAVNIRSRTNIHCKAQVRDSKKLHNAIKVHGITDFKVAVIEFCSAAKDELNRLEIEWIAELNTFWDRHDHNLTPGGEGGRGGALTLDDFKVLVEQLRQTGPDALDFTEIGRYWGYERSNIRKINLGMAEYTREYAEELGIAFPIRSTEETSRVAHNKSKANNPQCKDWNLVVTYGYLNELGRYEETGREILGEFRGHDDAWQEIVEIEKTRYGTSDEELASIYQSFRKGFRGAANVNKLSNKRGSKGARRYTLEPIN